MMAISTKGRYSVAILRMMASQPYGRTFTRHEIAEAEEISPAYVQQLMMRLAAAGFVTSHRGTHGGFRLARAPETITVADVLQVSEGQIVLAPCAGAVTCKREQDCPTRGLWIRAVELLESLFQGVTIAELAGDGAKGWCIGS
jgi:Rrf2 family protein